MERRFALGLGLGLGVQRRVSACGGVLPVKESSVPGCVDVPGGSTGSGVPSAGTEHPSQCEQQLTKELGVSRTTLQDLRLEEQSHRSHDLHVEELSTRATIKILRRDIPHYTGEIETADARLRVTQLREQRVGATLEEDRAEVSALDGSSGMDWSHSKTEGATLVRILEKQRAGTRPLEGQYHGQRTTRDSDSPASLPRVPSHQAKATTAVMVAPTSLENSLKQARTQLQA